MVSSTLFPNSHDTLRKTYILIPQFTLMLQNYCQSPNKFYVRQNDHPSGRFNLASLTTIRNKEAANSKNEQSDALNENPSTRDIDVPPICTIIHPKPSAETFKIPPTIFSSAGKARAAAKSIPSAVRAVRNILLRNREE
mmetsp:Transcript_8694/g.12835  ORF Transcript_8694/g.12835 Transcript_8694/m.12835 type:complete len:139 (+) Transcript_8694:201-617(+)